MTWLRLYHILNQYSNIKAILNHPKGEVSDCIVTKEKPNDMLVYGTTAEIKTYLEKWLSQFKNRTKTPSFQDKIAKNGIRLIS